jgi:hypothetical protein
VTGVGNPLFRSVVGLVSDGWAARKIARLTGATEGGAYQMLESALIETERLPRLNPRDHHHPT